MNKKIWIPEGSPENEIVYATFMSSISLYFKLTSIAYSCEKHI